MRSYIRLCSKFILGWGGILSRLMYGEFALIQIMLQIVIGGRGGGGFNGGSYSRNNPYLPFFSVGGVVLVKASVISRLRHITEHFI